MIKVSLQDITYSPTPFPHCVIDNFLLPDACASIHRAVSALRLKDANNKFVNPSSVLQHNKFAFDNPCAMEPCLGALFDELVSPSFIAQMEKLTGITGLVAGDRILRGAGVHLISSGGLLGLHTDFNRYQHPVHGTLDRRINLLLYLNEDWKPEYGGELQLVDEQTCSVHKIPPKLNTCVIFNTTSKSIHGHPEPWAAPEGVRRQSVAMYYYTKGSGKVDFEGDRPHSTIWHTQKRRASQK